jgi:hypothetical protein
MICAHHVVADFRRLEEQVKSGEKKSDFPLFYTSANFLITFCWKGFVNFLTRYNITERDFHENRNHGNLCALKTIALVAICESTRMRMRGCHHI